MRYREKGSEVWFGLLDMSHVVMTEVFGVDWSRGLDISWLGLLEGNFVMRMEVVKS